MSRPDRKRVVISTSPARSQPRPAFRGQPARPREGLVALCVIGAAALATFLALLLTSRPYDPMNSTFDAQQSVPSGARVLQSPTPTPIPGGATGIATPSPATEAAGETGPVDDSTIQAQIERAARSDPALENLDVSTIVEGGRVTIVGAVSSPELKQRVERTIRAIRGVVSVDNQLAVIEPTPHAQAFRQRDSPIRRSQMSVGVN